MGQRKFVRKPESNQDTKEEYSNIQYENIPAQEKRIGIEKNRNQQCPNKESEK